MIDPNGHNSEAEWIRRAQAGDQAAYGQLVRQYQRLIISVAYRQGLDLAEAEDVAQETFVKAWLALPRYRPAAGTWRAWLCRIALHQAIDTQRRARPRLSLDETLPDRGRGPAEQAEDHLQAQRVRQALAGLPPASRAALILSEYEGLSYAEIAAALEIPLGTVMSRLHYARRLLRERLSADAPAAETPAAAALAKETATGAIV